MKFPNWLIPLIAAPLMAFAPQAMAGEIKVTAQNVANFKSPLKVAVLTKQQFDDDIDPSSMIEQVPSGVKTQININTVAAGEYAVMVFQDINSNGELDFGLTGPSEPFGISGNPKMSIFSMPKWEEIKVVVTEKPIDVSIKLK